MVSDPLRFLTPQISGHSVPRHQGWRVRAAIAAVGLAAATVVTTAHAQAERSPFQAPDSQSAPAPTAASPLDNYEFRGVMTIGDETFITLVDKSNSRALTLALGAEVEGLRATDFRAEDGSVQVESGGQARRLQLQDAKIVALAVPPATPNQPPHPGANRPPVMAGAPMSDEEARARMQRVAEEIRRRREMRRQMLEGRREAAQSNN